HADDRAVLHFGGRGFGCLRVARPLLRPEQRGALLPHPGRVVDPGGHPDRRLQQEDQQADGRRALRRAFSGAPDPRLSTAPPTVGEPPPTGQRTPHPLPPNAAPTAAERNVRYVSTDPIRTLSCVRRLGGRASAR